MIKLYVSGFIFCEHLHGARHLCFTSETIIISFLLNLCCRVKVLFWVRLLDSKFLSGSHWILAALASVAATAPQTIQHSAKVAKNSLLSIVSFCYHTSLVLGIFKWLHFMPLLLGTESTSYSVPAWCSYQGAWIHYLRIQGKGKSLLLNCKIFSYRCLPDIRSFKRWRSFRTERKNVTHTAVS